MTKSPGPVSIWPITRRRAWLGAAAATGAGVLFFSAWCVHQVNERDRVMPGVYLEDLNVSRLTEPEIRARIQRWQAEHQARKISFSLASRPLVFEPKTAAFSVDVEASAADALSVGRSPGFARRLSSYLSRLIRPERLSMRTKLDSKRLAEVLDDWEMHAIADPPFAGGIGIDGTSITPLYPHAGTRLDRPRVKRQLLEAFRTGSDARGSDAGPIATQSETPRVPRAEVDRVASQARAMLSGDVLLVSEDGARRVQLTAAQIASVLRVSAAELEPTLRLSCAPEATHQLLEPQLSQLEQPPQNARFVIDAQDRVHIEPGRAGLRLDDRSLALAVCAAAQSAEKKGTLPLAPGAEPALSTAAAEQAGIVGLVGTYTTRHACCQPRVENIHHIADLLDGTLVRPGETFSVNQLVGPRTVKNGFRAAPSIEDGDMVDTIGGGVSQFATTLFNALFYAGYDILERQPHSYWFTRYPMGYDATLSYPHPDIVFKNDTEACALIKTQYTDTTITVKIYGNNGGRRVRAEVSERQNIVLPPVEFIPNPRLDADEEKTREGGMIGWTVTVTRTLTFGDGKLKKERRKVTYKPRARRVEVHPCRVPAGEPGHTGERCPVPEKEPPLDSAPTDASAK